MYKKRYLKCLPFVEKDRNIIKKMSRLIKNQITIAGVINFFFIFNFKMKMFFFFHSLFNLLNAMADSS